MEQKSRLLLLHLECIRKYAKIKTLITVEMKRLLPLFILVGFFFIEALSQVTFKEGHLYGIKEKGSGKILVSPKYYGIGKLNDSLFVVIDSLDSFKKKTNIIKTMVVNLNGDTILNYGEPELGISYDSLHYGRIFSRITVKPAISPSRYYDCFTNVNRECIPYDYYPCPATEKVSNDITLSDYLLVIQKAEETKNENSFLKTIENVKRSIELAPDNPYPYYWGAKYLSDNYITYSTYHNIGLMHEPNLLNEWINKADSIENRGYYRVKINNIKLRMNKHNNKGYLTNRKLYKESEKYAHYIYSNGFAAIVGYEFLSPRFIEIGIGLSYRSKNNVKTLLGNPDADFLLLGITYLHSYVSDFRGYKLYLISIHSPVRFGVSTMFMKNTNYDFLEGRFVFRPELGYTYKHLTAFYGYNLYKENEVITGFPKHVVGLRYILQLFPEKQFE